MCVDVCVGACVSACLCGCVCVSRPDSETTHPGVPRPCRDGQREAGREQLDGLIDGCRATVRRVASWLNHAASRARAGLNLFKYLYRYSVLLAIYYRWIVTHSRAVDLRDSYD